MFPVKTKPWFGLSLAILTIFFIAGCSLANTPTPTIPATTTPTKLPTATVIPTPTATKITALKDVSTMTPTATSEHAFIRQGDTLSVPDAGSPTLTYELVDTNILCTVNVNTLNLREGPGPNYHLIRTLSSNESVSALKCVAGGAWLLVETAQKEIGWLKATLVNCQDDVANLPVARGIVAQAPPSPTPSAQPPDGTTTPTIIPTPTPTLSLDVWRGEYYDNASLLGEPVLIRADPELDFNWILDSPAPGIPADNFSVRWTRLFDFFEGGDYRFFADVDDGVRVYVDGWLVIDAWHTFIPVPYSGDFADIQSGIHTVTVEYFESGGHAKVKVWAEKTRFIDSEWLGEYYPNSDWQGQAFLIRSDKTIDFDWGQDSPADGMDGNHFSVRWTRTIFFDAGDYEFFAEVADRDRVKIYLDGWPLVDEYTEDRGTLSGYFADVGAGYHDVVVEYSENVGQAKVKVWWEKD
jgi:hypothetical protein